MEKRTKRRGDRPDAYWIRDLDGLHAIMPHLMNKRTDAEVYVNMEFDVTEALRYIEEKNRREDEYKTTLFHCILMAVAKTVYLRPDLNRYISGRRYYQRHEITLGFVAKKRFEDHSEEKLVVATAPEDWTLTAVTRQVVGKVQGPNGEERRCQRYHGYPEDHAPLVPDAFLLGAENSGFLWEGACCAEGG